MVVNLIIEVMEVGAMLTCSKETKVVTDLLNSIFTEQGSMYLGNKRKTRRGKHPFLWSPVSNHVIRALTNQPYQPLILSLHSPYSSIPS